MAFFVEAMMAVLAAGVARGEVEVAFFQRSRTWNGARDHCRSVGGELAKVSTAEANEELKSLVASSSSHVMWIGASDRNSEDTWVWLADGTELDGTASTYANWCGFIPLWGPPPNGGEFQNCLGMQRSGCWNDFGCFERLPFACEFGRRTESDAEQYCSAFGASAANFSGSREAFVGEDGTVRDCAEAVAEFDGRWAFCCCENRQEMCCPSSDECGADDDEEGTAPVFDSYPNRRCLQADNVVESYETCAAPIAGSDPSDPEDCWRQCEDTYPLPLAAAYANATRCCCSSHCLCIEESQGTAMALASGQQGPFNDGTDVLTCDALAAELAGLVDDDAADDVDDILDSYFTLDDLDDRCEPAACLELGSLDDDCCAEAGDAGCSTGYAVVPNSRETCYPAVGGFAARTATCCVPSEEAQQDARDDDELFNSPTTISSAMFLVDDGDRGDWSANVDYCVARGLETVSLADASEAADLARLLADHGLDEAWLGAEIRRRLWVWHDGSLADYLRQVLQGESVSSSSVRVTLQSDAEWTIVAADHVAAVACKFQPSAGADQPDSHKKKKTKDNHTPILVLLLLLCLLVLCAIALLAFFLRKKYQLFSYTAAAGSGDVIIADSVELMKT